jgi:16S rRNA (adenine1518-N6/adenine1519-N6)-dimethyltransferase
MGKQSTYFAIKNFFPSKKMGQNFLIDENIAQKIAKLVDKDCFDAIIEVGPGGGILTKFLVLYNKPLIAIELDKRLASTLHNQFRKYQNLEIVNDDVLKIDLIKLAHHYVNPVLLSNLPYSISSPMILKFLKQDKIKTFYCMLQKEMVDRIIAKPGSKGYNAFTVLVS